MDNQYLVAKYAPDLDRMEPKNIGVIFWADGRVRTRFANPEAVGLQVDDGNYVRWITYWQRLAGEKRIQIEDRRAASVKSRRYMQEFLRAQRGNYILESGGEIADPVNNIDDAADFLFSRLVSATGRRDARGAETFKGTCDLVLKSAGIFERPNFVQNYPVPLKFGEFEKPLHFHYALASQGGNPHALLLRVHINNENNVTSAAGKFGSVDKTLVCPKNRCISLYEPPEDDELHHESIDFLKLWSVPVDVTSASARNTLLQQLHISA